VYGQVNAGLIMTKSLLFINPVSSKNRTLHIAFNDTTFITILPLLAAAYNVSVAGIARIKVRF
jgi:hypothetical protein